MKYAMSGVAEFYEVFDMDTKETVFVSESEAKAKQALIMLNKGQQLPERMEEVK